MKTKRKIRKVKTSRSPKKKKIPRKKKVTKKKIVKKKKRVVQKKTRKTAKRKRSRKKVSSKKKSVSKKKTKKVKAHKEILIGRVTHYFDKIKVAAITLTKTLKQGDELHFVGGEDTDFKQKASSLEINHVKVKRAKKGAEVGLKVNKKVREGYRVYR